jgi:hypothetical protein
VVDVGGAGSGGRRLGLAVAVAVGSFSGCFWVPPRRSAIAAPPRGRAGPSDGFLGWCWHRASLWWSPPAVLARGVSTHFESWFV